MSYRTNPPPDSPLLNHTYDMDMGKDFRGKNKSAAVCSRRSWLVVFNHIKSKMLRLGSAELDGSPEFIIQTDFIFSGEGKRRRKKSDLYLILTAC